MTDSERRQLIIKLKVLEQLYGKESREARELRERLQT